MNTIDVEGFIQAPPGAVWTVLTDMPAWTEWMGISEVVIERRAPDGSLGAGTVYVARTGLVRDRYEVVESDPPRRLRYRLVSGLFFRDYRGEIMLTPSGHGTALRWQTALRPRIAGTGWVFARTGDGLLRRAVRALGDRVGEHLAGDQP